MHAAASGPLRHLMLLYCSLFLCESYCWNIFEMLMIFNDNFCGKCCDSFDGIKIICIPYIVRTKTFRYSIKFSSLKDKNKVLYFQRIRVLKIVSNEQLCAVELCHLISVGNDEIRLMKSMLFVSHTSSGRELSDILLNFRA